MTISPVIRAIAPQAVDGCNGPLPHPVLAYTLRVLHMMPLANFATPSSYSSVDAFHSLTGTAFVPPTYLASRDLSSSIIPVSSDGVPSNKHSFQHQLLQSHYQNHTHKHLDAWDKLGDKETIHPIITPLHSPSSPTRSSTFRRFSQEHQHHHQKQTQNYPLNIGAISSLSTVGQTSSLGPSSSARRSPLPAYQTPNRDSPSPSSLSTFSTTFSPSSSSAT